jgi:hypothetical protein
MDDGAIFLTLAGSIAAVWLALYTALLIFAWRAFGRRLLVEARLIRRALRRRSIPGVVDGIGASMRSGLFICLAASFAPALLIVGPLLLAAGALTLTAQMVHFQ